MTNPLNMDGLSQLLYGHAAFQYLAAACELGLLDQLADGPLTKAEIQERLTLQERATDVLLLGTTATGLTVIQDGRYAVADVVRGLMDAGDFGRFCDIVAFYQKIVYVPQADFVESLRQNTNVGLRRVPGEGRDLYHRLQDNPELQAVFYRFMRSWSEMALKHLHGKLDLSGVRSLLDCGGGDAVYAIELARANPQLHVQVLEIDETVPIAQAAIEAADMTDRVSVTAGDMFDEFPGGDYDCVLFAHQMVIWTLEENTTLLKRAHNSLKDGGRVVIFNSISDDAGDGPFLAAGCSAYFASLPAQGGMIYSYCHFFRDRKK